MLASSALIELDLLLKKTGISNIGRHEVFESLKYPKTVAEIAAGGKVRADSVNGVDFGIAKVLKRM